MRKSNILLNLGIQRELVRSDYIFNDSDNDIAQEMLQEINKLGYNFHYFAEITFCKIPGSGAIISRYVNRFTAEATRAYLVAQMVYDNIPDCEKIILYLYLHFKRSNVYISKPNVPSPAHIYVCYDNAFKALKPKNLKHELLELASNPRDAYYLPFTMRMLASWRLPEIKELLISYLDDSTVTAQSIGICEDRKDIFPSLATIKHELKFTAIDGLVYYPSIEVASLIRQFTTDLDSNIRAAAQKALKRLEGKYK